MTIVNSPSSPSMAPMLLSNTAEPGPLAWELVFDGVWLARCDGRFAGMVQNHHGSVYKLTDARGNISGQFDCLGEARSALSLAS